MKFSNLKSGFAACIAAIILFSGCPNTVQPRVAENTREYVHPNSLVIILSEDFAAKQSANGFFVEPAGDANRNLRRPVEIKIDFNPGKNFPVDSKLLKKTIENRTISYKIEKSEGGSGGETYDFAGFENVPGGVIEYRQTTQSKAAEPDFSSLWEIIGKTALKK